MSRATIIVDAEDSAEVKRIDLWFDKWRPFLQYFSDQEGCGCCIYMWDVEGSDEAINELPIGSLADSEWSNPQRSQKR